jgi:FixJ family two-component response regulator
MESGQQTVVVAESDSITLAELQTLFATNAYRVLTVSGVPDMPDVISFLETPAVLVLGDLAGMDCVEYLKSSRWEIPTILLRSGNSIREAVESIQSGAEDYLTKPYSPQHLLTVVRKAMHKSAERSRLSTTNRSLLCRAAALTHREHEILNLILSGMLNKQIAEHLGLALVTVKLHRGHAMRKLGARTAAELARFAGAAGINPTHAALNRSLSARTNGFAKDLPQQLQ